ncbi:lysozyme-like [Periplaneta americana]|uniref:lysozyme n=1 Tax=Periplaneta americana TaxID=6978 RepID=I1XB28_PERAM|nr:i-type lysozyme [Periplaneta americana]
MATACKSLVLVAAAAIACSLFGSFTLGQQQPKGPVSDLCLGCICEAVSNCNQTLACDNTVCGLFRITWAYWADAGKPVLIQDNKDTEGAYGRCTKDPYCAALTVQGYMAKFKQDCNNDGVVTCFDYAAIHRLGGYGCTGPLDYNYQNRFLECQRQVQQAAGVPL